MDNRKLLEIKNLVTEFRSEDDVVKAVNNISFTLNKAKPLEWWANPVQENR